MKNKKRLNMDCVQTNVGCVVWNLPAIPCLRIETGDTLDEVTFAIVEKLCHLSGIDDLANIELQCVIDKLDINIPTEKTLFSYLQLAFDNDCALFDLVQDVKDLITNEKPSLKLDLKCLAQYDSLGNQLPYNEQTVLQGLINQGCSFVNQISGLSASLVNVNTRIDNIPTYTEPNLTSCLFTGSKSLSQTTTLLAADYCSYKNSIGSINSINSAIGNQTTILNDPLFPVGDLLPIVSSLSESNYNQWVHISDNYKRLLDLEACACRAKCSDIKVGWNVQDQDDGESVVIDFSGDYGNYIPLDYKLQSDSTITFIDRNKKQKSYPLPTTTGIFKTEYTSVPLDISMLDLGGMMVIKVCVKLKNTKTGEICCKCEESEHMFTGGCSYCELLATDKDVTVVYKVCSSTLHGISNCQTVSSIIKKGTTLILKKTDIVSYIDFPESLEGITCLDYVPEQLDCFVGAMGIKSKDLPTDYFEDSSQRITGFKFGGVEYSFKQAYYANQSTVVSGNPFPFYAYDTTKLLAELKDNISGILETKGTTFNFGANTTAVFQIKTTEDIANSLFLILAADAPHGNSTDSPIVFIYIPFFKYGTKYPNTTFPSSYTSLCATT